jgi:hypothetical protein
MGSWLTDGLIQAVLTWFTGMVVGALQALWDLLASTAFQSPDVATLPQVQTFASTSVGVVNAVYVLAFLYLAVMVMGRDTIQSRYGPGELVPRLVIGLIGANFALPVCSTVINLSNALTTALTGQSLTSPGSTKQLQTVVLSAMQGQDGGTAASFLLVVIGLLIAVLVGIFEVQWLMRIGLLIVVGGLSPIALALHGTPHTEGAAKLWWRTLLGTLATVVIQAVALHLTLSIFLSPGSNLPALGFPGDPTPLFNLLVVMCMLIGILKIPSLMRRYITQSRPSTAGQVFRLIGIQQITHGLSRALSRSAGASRAGGRGGRPTGGAGSGPAAGGPTPRGGPRWPTNPGGSRPASPPPRAPRPAPATTAPAPPSPAGAGPGVVAVAYPTGRPVRPYTRDELAGGVDLYTRALKRRAAAPSSGRTSS